MRALLCSEGLIRPDSGHLTPLSGGVSSEIYLFCDGPQKFVVKRALAQLKVAGQWFADISRNKNEAAYIAYVAELCPQHVPRLLHVSETHNYFCMEYFGTGWQTWKQSMINGERNSRIAAKAGALLGKIHAHSFRDRGAAHQFQTLHNFEQLRIEPYLLSTAQHHPLLQSEFHAEAARLRLQKQVLTHGDFSPKNILVKDEGLVVVDCEVAWYGDAAFDLAFLLNHLFLKSLALLSNEQAWRNMVGYVWSSYITERFTAAEADEVLALETNLVQLLPMLMLARVDGKSPAEYLSEEQRTHIRCFTSNAIIRPSINLCSFTDLWFRSLPTQGHSFHPERAQ
jgi:aminoglycoside phosphotransferase (APT) family kinase protein